MRERLSIPVAIATGIVPGLGARRAPPSLSIAAVPVLTAVQNQAYGFVAQVQNAVGAADLTIIDAAPGLTVTPLGENLFEIGGPITSFGSFEMVLRAEDELERTAFLGPFTVVVRFQTLGEAWGSKHRGLIDFADIPSLTLSSGRVSAVVDTVAGITFSQSFSMQRFLYDARGYVVGDGADDCLENTGGGIPYPLSGSASEIIGVVRQDRLAASTTGSCIFAYGTLNFSARQMRRVVASGINRLQAHVGDGAAASDARVDTVDFSGAHIARMIVGTAQTTAAIGGQTASVNVVPSTTEARARIGASVGSSATLFLEGAVAAIAITEPLTPEEWAAGQPWLEAAKARFAA